MTQFLSVTEIKQQVDKLAARAGIGADVMERHIAYGSGALAENWFECPYVEVNKNGYRYVVTERGKIYEDRQTQDVQDLLYWIFDSATNEVASHSEEVRKHYPVHWKQRRIWWKKQLELLEVISPDFRERCKREIAEILQTAPFTDGLPNNMDYEEWEDNAIVQEN